MAYWEWNATGNPRHPHVVVCVHGLSRQGRDFDSLARALSLHARVICPDVAGRGRSDWLRNPRDYQVPTYAADMFALLEHINAQAPVRQLDWIGTSMGGLIGIALCGQSDLELPVPIRRLLLNDIGPAIQWGALQRIGGYLGQPVHFASIEDASAYLASISQGFGAHTQQQWLELSRAMVRPARGGWELHYDPAIAQPLRALTQEAALQGEAVLWNLYDRINAETLLVRGGASDLLTREAALEMTRRGPHARLIEFDNVGHAPTFVDAQQIAVARDFILRDQATAE
jgi:pimeloyl-ACP methyl ester carboxylesterase